MAATPTLTSVQPCVIAHTLLRLPNQKWEATPDEYLPHLDVSLDNSHTTAYLLTAISLIQVVAEDHARPCYILECKTTNPAWPIINLGMDTDTVEPNSTKPLDYSRAYFNVPETLLHPLLSLTLSLEHGCIGFSDTKQIPLHTLNYACSLEETRQLLQQQIPDLPPQAFDAWTLPATLYPDLHWPQPLKPKTLTLCYEFSATPDITTFEQDPTEPAPETRYYSYPVENPDCTQALAFGFYGLRNRVILANILPLLMPAATAWVQVKKKLKPCKTYHTTLLLLDLDKFVLLPYNPSSTLSGAPVAGTHATYSGTPAVQDNRAHQLMQDFALASILPPTFFKPPSNSSPTLPSMTDVYNNISSYLFQQELSFLSC